MEEILRRYIATELAPGSHKVIGMETPLFESVLDSASVLALVSFVEQTFGLEIPDHEIVPANFSTLGKLCRYIQAKSVAVPAAI